jgi:hypothetical protein
MPTSFVRRNLREPMRVFGEVSFSFENFGTSFKLGARRRQNLTYKFA